ncbi:MAG TPA: DUF3034 family protein [Nitrosomonas sp.]|uniref:DUF3034 family protein n=1 Tax=Nitrosomonas sp. TaxID=42353 RepID=UPI00207F6085|nr:DUF3034 family protein [Nitrosomonas sp.]GJL74110.1 MAG: hypothetical protein NMNS02_02160 [Nitrosomonas sp.]HNP26637.1 DUF3034 family protein [Nitrosomonas sp.]
MPKYIQHTIKLKAAMLLCLLMTSQSIAGQGKLLETAGLTQIEGSGGGGIVPWATISGYDSRDETSVAVFNSLVFLDDYRLHAWGASIGLFDRTELSFARQNLYLSSGDEIRQNVYGIKTRLYGDLIYTFLPQISIGAQHKMLVDGTVATAVGAKNNDNGTDFYIAATKVHLGAVVGYNLIWNLAARATKANQLGLLGYGGERNNDYQMMLEGSVGVLLSRNWAIGYEYRQKPNNLAGVKENDWQDFFVAYIPNKRFNLTLAWTRLGDIAGATNQQGFYFSATGYLW